LPAKVELAFIYFTATVALPVILNKSRLKI